MAVSGTITSKVTNTIQTAPHLSLRVARSATDHCSFMAYQYARYPFRLSNNLRLDPTDLRRVYAYIMNASPGILSGDNLHLSVEVGAEASLYLTDQSATKVHSQSAVQQESGASAEINWKIKVGCGGYFEFMPEPIILFKSAALTQRMEITLHSQAQMVLSEIVVPGRMARGEFYDFEQFQSRLRIQNPEGDLLFVDNLNVLGRNNLFKCSSWLTDFPIIANFIAVVPDIKLAHLARELERHAVPAIALQVCDSPLPGCNGLWIRAIATQVSALKAYQRHLLSCVRQISGNAPLPPIPK
ncbi:MAG: urease accessory protein [Phormidesmis priestleyi]|uniref:Urease accessory protein UreD n=1 Tax=Phormidesmis priestleyi TaxID=268141 RepID=A0A2W4XJ79_9CYAN|nr:MAG: urease accessory protein [Phormidesmis priestleyi]